VSKWWPLWFILFVVVTVTCIIVGLAFFGGILYVSWRSLTYFWEGN
jgi:hypothetical protein